MVDNEFLISDGKSLSDFGVSQSFRGVESKISEEYRFGIWCLIETGGR